NFIHGHRWAWWSLLVSSNGPSIWQAPLYISQIRSGIDGEHSRGGGSGAGVDRNDSCMSNWAAHHSKVNHAWKAEVIGVFSSSRDEAGIFFSFSCAPNL